MPDCRFVENTPWLNTRQVSLILAMDIQAVFAANLRRHRRAAGLSQEELAHRAGIDRTYISSLERSVYSAGIDVVDRLARSLGTTAAKLLEEASSDEGAH